MKIAIYARKSRLSDKGESINNQIDACKNYILHWGNVTNEEVTFITYKDEGFSGSNTDRPEFKKLLNDAKSNKFDKLICYRLDRISRSVADFSTTYELLNVHNIEFVSVKEQFDTSTPIGRAMLNIAMVFAQLERETIAERVRDNMLALAKTGRWLGGKTPTGFISKQLAYNGDVNAKKMYVLEPVTEELKLIDLIFTKFLEIKSLRGLESYLLINDIVTPNQCTYTASTLRDILTNPVYAAADQDTYNYLSSMNCNMCMSETEFDGTYGLMVYNRTDQSGSKTTEKPSREWVISIGKHAPTIPGHKWVYVQQLIKSNTGKQFYNKQGMEYGLLASLIKCKCCGSTMKVKKGKLMADGTQAFVYICSTKDMSRKTKCNVKNIIGQEADKDVFDYLVNLAKDGSLINQIIASNEINCQTTIAGDSSKINAIEDKLQSNTLAINNLMSQMAQLDPSSTLISHYLTQLKVLDEEKQDLTQKLESLKNNIIQSNATTLNLQVVKDALKTLSMIDKSSSMQEQRSIIRTIVEKIEWNGTDLHVELFGQKVMETLCTDTHLCNNSECDSYSRGCNPVCNAK